MPVHLEALIGGPMSNKKLRIPGPARTSRLGEPSRRGKTYHYVLRAFPNGQLHKQYPKPCALTFFGRNIQGLFTA